MADTIAFSLTLSFKTNRLGSAGYLWLPGLVGKVAAFGLPNGGLGARLQNRTEGSSPAR
jgi:hypothetical protein